MWWLAALLTDHVVRGFLNEKLVEDSEAKKPELDDTNAPHCHLPTRST